MQTAANPASDLQPLTEAAASNPDALNEDLSRILLGEVAAYRVTLPESPPNAAELLRRARVLAEELAQLSGQLEWNTGSVSACDSPIQTRPEIWRIRSLASELTELFDLAASSTPE